MHSLSCVRTYWLHLLHFSLRLFVQFSRKSPQRASNEPQTRAVVSLLSRLCSLTCHNRPIQKWDTRETMIFACLVMSFVKDLLVLIVQRVTLECSKRKWGRWKRGVLGNKRKKRGLQFQGTSQTKKLIWKTFPFLKVQKNPFNRPLKGYRLSWTIPTVETLCCLLVSGKTTCISLRKDSRHPVFFAVEHDLLQR